MLCESDIPPHDVGQAGCPRLSRFVGSSGGGRCLGLVGMAVEMAVEIAVEVAVEVSVGRLLVRLLRSAIALACHLCGSA